MDDNYVVDIDSEESTFKFDSTNPKVRQIANMFQSKRDNPNQGRLYDTDGISPTLGAMEGGGRQPFIPTEAVAYDEQNRYLRKDGTVGTLTTDGSSPKHNNRVIEPTVWDGFNQRVRKDQSCVGTLTQNCGADLKRNGQGIIEPITQFDLSDKMKKYINSYDDKYKVSNGNLMVNRGVACAKTTREGCTRADASDYIAEELDENENVAGMELTQYRIRKLTPK